MLLHWKLCYIKTSIIKNIHIPQPRHDLTSITSSFPPQAPYLSLSGFCVSSWDTESRRGILDWVTEFRRGVLGAVSASLLISSKFSYFKACTSCSRYSNRSWKHGGQTTGVTKWVSEVWISLWTKNRGLQNGWRNLTLIYTYVSVKMTVLYLLLNSRIVPVVNLANN